MKHMMAITAALAFLLTGSAGSAAGSFNQTGSYTGTVKISRFNIDTGARTDVADAVTLTLNPGGGYTFNPTGGTMLTVADGVPATGKCSLGPRIGTVHFKAASQLLTMSIQFPKSFSSSGKCKGTFRYTSLGSPNSVEEGTFVLTHDNN